MELPNKEKEKEEEDKNEEEEEKDAFNNKEDDFKVNEIEYEV